MKSLSRPHVPPSTQRLMQILERPGRVAAVRELPGYEDYAGAVRWRLLPGVW